jgi:uncharacterized membrane protein (DUF4010 family)
MRASDIIRLLLLAAIWGGSFVFLRVVAPVLGPIVTADLRVLIAWALWRFTSGQSRSTSKWGQFWQQYLSSARLTRHCRFIFSPLRIAYPGFLLGDS